MISKNVLKMAGMLLALVVGITTTGCDSLKRERKTARTIDPTIEYWEKLEEIKNGPSLGESSPKERIAILQSTIAEMKSLPTAKVDPSLVALTKDIVELMQRFLKITQDQLILEEKMQRYNESSSSKMKKQLEREKKAFDRQCEQFYKEVDIVDMRFNQMREYLQKRFGEDYIQ